jgi:hypothetical protein
MKVFTTINPYGNHDVQVEATKSWANKFKIYSVNLKEEIEIAKDLYPHVTFLETTDIYEHGKKKLIRLNSILDAALNQNCEYLAIVNSDIILSEKTKKIFDKKYLDNSIMIATRWELDNQKSEKYPFNNGYDLFIFHRSYINLFKNKNYVIGMPWWDFYIPTIALKSGMKIYHIKNPVIFHKTHETNYDMDSWRKTHIIFSSCCNVSKNNVQMGGTRRYWNY